MNNNVENLNEILKIFNKHNLSNDFMLIGSWCEFFYQKYFDNFQSFMKTRDFDFYVKNKHITDDAVYVSKDFKENGFKLNIDYISGKTIFIKDDNTVEFLTGLDRQQKDIYSIDKLGIYAESLSRLDIFDNNYLDIEYKGLHVRIPTPSAYVIHKLIINSERKTEKAEKDILAIKGLLLQIKKSYDDFESLKKLYNSDIIGKKGRNKINQVCSKNNIDLFAPFSIEDELSYLNDSMNYEKTFVEENKVTDIEEKLENINENLDNSSKNVERRGVNPNHSWHDDFDDYEF